MNTKRTSGRSRCACASIGISRTQGPHQVAHRLTSTGLPPWAARSRRSPFNCVNWSAGSGAEAGCSASWICPATISAVPIASGTVAGTRKPGAFLSRKVAYIHIAMIPISGDQPPSRRLRTLSGCST